MRRVLLLLALSLSISSVGCLSRLGTLLRDDGRLRRTAVSYQGQKIEDSFERSPF